MRRLAAKFVASLLVLASPLGALAHHNSNAYFDTTQEFALQGTVTRFDWRNPHSYIYVDATGVDGEVVSWRLEGGPVALMRRMGWTRDTLRPGDEVTAIINPSRNPRAPSGLLRNVDVAGREVPPVSGEAANRRLVGDDSAPSARAEGLAGTWVTLLDAENPELLGFFNEPAQRPLTDAGNEAVASFDERTMHTGLDCIPYTAPLLMAMPDTKQIEVREDAVLIRGEFDGTERIVHLDAPETGGPTIHGHSVGRWEEGALAIETRLRGTPNGQRVLVALWSAKALERATGAQR
jgi:hypothetical protein